MDLPTPKRRALWLDQAERIPEWRSVSRDVFESEILPTRRPAVLRGVGADWPVVLHAGESARSVANYLASFYRGEPAQTYVIEAAANGRMFYSADLKGFNFSRSQQDLKSVLNSLLADAACPSGEGIAIQSAQSGDLLPDFTENNRLDLLEDVPGRLWLCNRMTVAPHYDSYDNIACVAAGRRRFVVFPPDQLPNLYVGPLDRSPAGAPISLVSVDEPELDRFPRYAQAMAAAQVAELEPGDAIFIPYMWWHGVQALEPFNLLVNYWWNNPHLATGLHPTWALTLAWLALRKLPQEHRQVWKRMFDHYVFAEGDDPLGHVPEDARAIFGDLSPTEALRARQFLAKMLMQG